MTARADVLILEDNPTELSQISTVIEAAGLVTLPTRSPAQARRLLRANDPSLAIVDWDMRLSPDAEETAEGVLKLLAVEHPETYTIVFATRAGTDMDLQQRIGAAHPAAITHDKRQGLSSLLDRVRQLLRRKVGDLQLHRGTVIHLPSGQRFKNKWGVRILCGHPEPVQAARDSAAYMALYRFNRWLEQVGSTVSVESEGASFYHLTVDRARTRRAAHRG